MQIEGIKVAVCFDYSEILRVIDSVQLADRLKVIATPASWTVSVYR
jgi:alkyl hydroperoxide reductase subunit AhpC